MLAMLTEWCWEPKAEFHIGTDKTVAMVVSGTLMGSTEASLRPLCLPQKCRRRAGSGQPLVFKNSHRWLGLRWPADLVFRTALTERVAIARSVFSELPFLVASKAIPLTIALELFESKVDGVLAFGRWCFTLADCAQEVLDDVYQEWALALLGGDRWRNAAVAMSELGWKLSGHSRALVDVALRRARVWTMASGLLYRDAFQLAHNSGAPLSWAIRSANLLKAAGLVDWPQAPSNVRTLEDYSELVKSTLELLDGARAVTRIQEHRATVPHYVFQVGPSPHLRAAKALELPWQIQLCMRAWCRFRAGLVVLAGKNGRRSAAKFQSCLFCQSVVRNAVVHCLSTCPRWECQRLSFKEVVRPSPDVTKDLFARLVLGCVPGDAAFCLVAAWFDEIDSESQSALS